MRQSPLMTIGLVAAAALWGCGGGSSASSAPAGAAAATDAAAGVPADATATQAGGPVQAVTIVEAVYATGAAHVEVSGGKQLTLDGQLVAGASMTVEGGTLLLYSAGEGESASVFAISNGGDSGIGFTLTAPGVVSGGDASTGCAINLTKNDASGVEGNFDCQGQTTVGLDQATIGVRATFSAAP